MTTNFVFLTSIGILIHASKLLNGMAEGWLPAPLMHLLPDRYPQQKGTKGCWFEHPSPFVLNHGILLPPCTSVHDLQHGINRIFLYPKGAVKIKPPEILQCRCLASRGSSRTEHGSAMFLRLQLTTSVL